MIDFFDLPIISWAVFFLIMITLLCFIADYFEELDDEKGEKDKL